MPLTPNPSALRVVGIAAQTAFGTPAASPTYFLRVSKFEGNVVTKPLFDESFQGDLSDNHQVVTGTSHVEVDGTLVGALDTIGFPLVGILGDEVFTAGVSPAPNTHAIVLGTAQPAFYTIFDYTGPVTRVYQDIMFSDVSLSGDMTKVVECTFKGTGSSVTTGGAPAPSWTTELPLTGWASTFSIGSATPGVAGYAESWSIDLKRDVQPIFTANGQRTPTAIVGTTLDATGKLTAVVNGTGIAELTAFEAGTERYISITLTPNGGGSESLKIEALSAIYADGKLVVGATKDIVKFEGDFHTVAAPTTLAGATGISSPVQITLMNAVANSIYA